MNFRRRRMRGMDETPAAVDRRMVEQPLQWPLSAPGDAFADFPHLLSDVNMDRPSLVQDHYGAQLFERHRPQRMRRNADDRTRQPRHGMAAGLQQFCKSVDAVDETPLARVGIPAAKSCMSIKHRQKRQADAGGMRGRSDPLG